MSSKTKFEISHKNNEIREIRTSPLFSEKGIFMIGRDAGGRSWIEKMPDGTYRLRNLLRGDKRGEDKLIQDDPIGLAEVNKMIKETLQERSW